MITSLRPKYFLISPKIINIVNMPHRADMVLQTIWFFLLKIERSLAYIILIPSKQNEKMNEIENEKLFRQITQHC